MPTDKKITELPVASAISAGDVSVLVDAGTDYQYSFTQLLQFLEANLVIGAKITFGTVLPQNTDGSNNDVFVNTAAGSFAQKIAGTWTVVYTLPPANAADGTMLYGAGTPSPATGKNLDSYIDTLTGIFYYKNAGAWAQIFSMATGPQGPQGTAGTNGTNGTNGNTILYGTTIPSNSTTGQNGDFYLNTATYTLYGPKAAGVWPVGSSIIGAAGNTVISGTSAPISSIGNNGDFFINTSANYIYGPKVGGSWPTGISLIGPSDSVSYYGSIYNKSTWTNLADFAVNGATVSLVSGELQLNGGTGGYTQTLDLNTGNSAGTALAKWKQTITLIAPTITSTSYGVGLSIRSTNSPSTGSTFFGAQAQINLSSGSLGVLSIALQPTNTVVSTSISSIPVTAGDAIVLTFERNGTQLTATVHNQTQNSALVSVFYTYPVTYSTNFIQPNTGKFGISSYGGTVNIVGYSIYSSEIMNADIMFVGDSKTVGYYSGSSNGGFAYLVGAKFNVNVCAGGNDVTADVLLHISEIIALKPKAIILSIGCNDKRYGIPDTVRNANITSIRASCITAGILVYLLLPLSETSGLDQSSLKTFLLGLDASKCIDAKTEHYSGITAPDGIHLNAVGNKIVADSCILSGYFSVTNIPGFDLGNSNAYPYYNVNGKLSSSSQVNTSDGSDVLIGEISPTIGEKLALIGGAYDIVEYIERSSNVYQALVAIGTHGSTSGSNPRWVTGLANTFAGYIIAYYDGIGVRRGIELLPNGTNATVRLALDKYIVSTVGGYSFDCYGMKLNSSGQWEATQTSAVSIGTNNGIFTITYNTGLTIGATFTPTNLYQWDLTGFIPQTGGLNLGSTSKPWNTVYASNAPFAIGQTPLTAGTVSINIPGLTSTSKAFITIVTRGGTVTTTFQYTAVCTTNTLTLIACDNASGLNTSDTSILNYQVYK